MPNWDDAQFALALSRSGTIRGAAKSLGVNHATVSRRINALEKRLSARLFEQTPSGYVMTESGRIITQAAEKMEDSLLGSLRKIEGADTELSGEVHMHIPDIFTEWVCEQLASFSIEHPKLRIRLTTDTSVADIAKREADIALRFSNYPPEDLVGQKVCKLPVALYASSSWVIDPTRSIATYPWIRWAKMFRETSVEQWAEKASEGATPIMSVTTYQTLTSLIRNGVGIGCLSPWFADGDSKLKKLTEVIEEIELDVWVLIHPDLRGVRRIKVLKDLLIDLFRRKVESPLSQS